MIVLIRYWREAVIVALVLTVLAACRARDNALRDEGAAKVLAAQQAARLHVADSVREVLASDLYLAQHKIVHDTLRLTQWFADTVQTWRHDTVTVNGEPSFVVPVGQVVKDDSSKAVCRELVTDCATFQRKAFQRFALDSSVIADLKAHPRTVRASSWQTKVLYGVGGAVLGWVVHR